MKHHTYRKWTPDEVERLRELVQQALTYDQIAEAMGRSYRSVKGAVNYHRMTQEGRRATCFGTQWTRAEYDQLEQLVAEGLTKQAIGEQMGRSYDQVRGAMNRLGLTDPARQAHNRKPWQIETIIRDCIQIQRLTVPQIAQHLAALGYPASVCLIHSRIREMPRDVRREMVANAKARRARLRSINARRERARKRQQEAAA